MWHTEVSWTGSDYRLAITPLGNSVLHKPNSSPDIELPLHNLVRWDRNKRRHRYSGDNISDQKDKIGKRWELEWI